ncbi:MAG TPA: TetR/AcrR family transcriptional regulator [Edaphobacter sp.]
MSPLASAAVPKSTLKSATPRKPRSDAQRNRLHILEIAHDAFARSGAEVTMDEIAKLAKVGPGTLYRHFPTREALIEAVYRTELEKLATAERELAATFPPVEALRAWMKLFVDYMATKLIISPVLYKIVAGGNNVFECSQSLIEGAMSSLLAKAVASGDIRADVEPMDLLWALYGSTQAAPKEIWPIKAKQLVDILIRGAKP